MFRVTPFALFVLTLLALGHAMTASAEGWREPLPDRPVSRPFAYDRATPFAGGARRGIELTASPGARVGAVCGGVVTWAGRVPRWGKGVTLRCPDGLIATELGLVDVAVARGAHVLPGTRVGRLWASGVLRVGARRSGDRFGWVDPEPLFAGGRALPPLAPAPSRSSRRTARPTAAVPPADAPRNVGPASPVPLPVLLGVVLLAGAATGGPAVRRRRHGRPIAEIAVASR